MNIDAARAALGTALAGVGVHVYAYEPDDPYFPSAVVGWPATPVVIAETVTGGLWRYTLPVIVTVARTGDTSSETALAALLTKTGATSAVAALGAGSMVAATGLQYMLVDIRDFRITEATVSAVLTVEVIA